ncbi:MAG: hypothetical protein AAFV88_02040 [Planctomycetota bacterium]
MERIIDDFAAQMFVGPVWPASILVCLMVMYTVVALIGLIDLNLDAPDIDLDADVGIDIDTPDLDLDGLDLDGPDLDLGGDVDAGNVDLSGGDAAIGQAGSFEFLTGLMTTTVRWTNFGRMPLILWVGVFAMIYWSVSYGLWHVYDSHRYSSDLFPSVLLGVRNLVMAIVATKIATQPFVDKFQPPPAYDKKRLLGATCEISSITASETFGQAKFRTNAAPLLLNVRTTGNEIPKGTEVRIIDFKPAQRLYIVTDIEPETRT